MLNTTFSPWPIFSNEEIEAVQKVLKSGKVNYWTGNECRKFETEFAQFSDSNYAIALANGTVALDLALIALGIGPGDEVIVTPRTFLASVSSVISVGAKPVFADVDPKSQNITPDTINEVITNRTKALICVHLAGWPCDMDEIMEIANQESIFVIEDCAQAHGSKYKGKSVGSFGHVNAWSFCQDKIMTTGGEGGMVTTNDEKLWKKMWAYKDHGKSYDAVYNQEHPPGYRWLHTSFGTNWRMTEMQAAIGRIQLTKMPEWFKKRRSYAKQLDEACRHFKSLRVPETNKDIEHGYYKYYVFVKPEHLNKNWSRDRIIKEINNLGVPCYSGSCSEVYLEKAFDGTNLRPIKRLPNAKALGETSLMFLVHPTLKKEEIDKTCSTIKSVMMRASN